MKYDIHCFVFNMTFTKLMKQYFKAHPNYDDPKKLLKSITKEYKAMIKRTPGLSKDNNMADNLKGAAYFFSASKVIPNMTPEVMDDIVDFMFSSEFMINLYKKQKANGTMFTFKAQDKMYKDSLRSLKSNDEMDWKYEYFKGTNDIRYNITKCGVKRLAERENVLEYLPCMCKMDYPKYKLRGATLLRDKTLASGDELCNFHLVRDEEENKQ